VLRICLIVTCAGLGGLFVGSSLNADLAEKPVITAMHAAPRASDILAARVELAQLRAEQARAMRTSSTTQARMLRRVQAPERAAL
jgi:hypothetical protein